jgi:hypothetical protein
MLYRRTGTCNQCGQCCGAEGSPNPASPYPKNWPSAIRHWSLDDAVTICPQLGLFGLQVLPGPDSDLIGIPAGEEIGRVKILGDRFYYAWTAQGIRKDTSPAHDGTSTNQECPFLLDDPGDGSRPCGLVGGPEDGARFKYCRPEEHTTDYDPAKDLWSDRSVQQWQQDHPLCSYVFVEAP